MKNRHSRSTPWLLAAFALFVACGDSLIVDPSFELWCGKTLCAPWEVTGDVEQVKTWHRSDFGVALADGALLSQLSTHTAVKCIEFEVIADVDASAAVWLEMDFKDDGSSEYKQLIPESHWAKLRYLVKAPTWYERVRFILRKSGFGHAALAQIKATESSDCGTRPPVPETNRPNGAKCENAKQCESGVCAAPEARGNGQADFSRACSDCSSQKPCADDALCGAALNDYGPYLSCVVPGSGQLGAICVHGDECASGHCSSAYFTARGSCAECVSDDDCPTDQVCGLGIFESAGARSCQPRNLRALGEFCAVDGECQSGVCQGVCSECSDSQPCAAPASCEGPLMPFSPRTRLCIAGVGRRVSGELCSEDSDCNSSQCDLPDPTCYLCEGASCDEMNTLDCVITRRHAGTCR
jgi:hypothetical protein